MSWYKVIVIKDDGGDDDGEVFSQVIRAEDTTDALDKASMMSNGDLS